jgi:hypothetical protein
MENCKVCGKSVRLGAYKIVIYRQRGVSHYIAHTDGSPMHNHIWECTALKPYPVLEQDKPWRILVNRWNAANLRT